MLLSDVVREPSCLLMFCGHALSGFLFGPLLTTHQVPSTPAEGVSVTEGAEPAWHTLGPPTPGI